jgi:ParB family chromosome partitioning protein
MEGTIKRKMLELPPQSIRPNPRQPRVVFEEEGIRALADSIRRCGLIQPLTVRRAGDGWELIAGERRLRAARLAGMETVPCVVSTADEDGSALLALVENLQRRDLHYFEEASAIADYIRRSGITQEEAALRLSRSPSALANKLRLLRLGEECRRVLTEAGLTERHARALLRLEEERERLAAVKHIAKHHLNVAQAEQYIERRLAALQKEKPGGKRTFILKDVRLFLNSIDRGVHMMKEAGVHAKTEREETEEEILLTIHIPKARKTAGKGSRAE